MVPIASAAIAALSLVACGSPAPRPDGTSAPDVRTGMQVAASDAVLTARLKEELKREPLTRDAEIYVSVSQRRVRLSGFVDTAAAKLRAGAVALATEGIETIENRLILRHSAEALQSPIGDVRVHL